MIRLLKKDLIDIVWGATLLGSGGGGSPENGLELVQEMSKISEKIELLEAEEVSDMETIVTVAGMGAPKALKEKGFGPEAKYAFEALQKALSISGTEIGGIMPVETGGFNSVVPIYVSSSKGIPLVDFDGAGGRAVPELGTLLYAIYGIPSNPLALADKEGNEVIIWLKDPLDAKKAEEIGRYVTVSFGQLAGLAGWPIKGWEAKRFMQESSLSRALELGRAIREARESGKDPVKAAVEALDGIELFRGEIYKIEIRTEAGFDFGRTCIRGTGEYEGKEFYVDFKNENMIAWLGDGPKAMVPDMICLMTLEGTPITNADTKEGQKIAVIGFKASEKWRKGPKFFEPWRRILEKMGYSGEYKAIEELQRGEVKRSRSWTLSQYIILTP